MKEARRLDLVTGEVPDYRTFVRHLWKYQDPAGFEIAAPPVMYRALFEDKDSDWLAIRDIAEYVVDSLEYDHCIQWAIVEAEDGLTTLWELQFFNLKALHLFCVTLGQRAQVHSDEVCTRVGEFVMWTLGFRWI